MVSPAVRYQREIELFRNFPERRLRAMGFARRVALCFALSLFGGPFSTAQTSILGFTPSSAIRENQIEKKFKAIPAPEEERRQHRIFTSQPHVAGSKRNNALADYIADEWHKQGLEDVIIRRYDVYGSNPKSTFLEMVTPVHYR